MKSIHSSWGTRDGKKRLYDKNYEATLLEQHLLSLKLEESNFEKYEEVSFEVTDPYINDQIEPISSFAECSVDSLLLQNLQRMQYVKPSAV